MKIKNEIVTQNLCYTYEARDISNFNCSELIDSENIADNIIAILCRIKDIDAFYQKLMQKLGKLESKKREDYLRKLFYLMRLRPNIAKILKQKEKESNMPFILDREIDPLYREGLEKGLEKVKEAKIVIAKALLKQNIDTEVIIKSTGLSKEEIEKLIPNQTN